MEKFTLTHLDCSSNVWMHWWCHKSYQQQPKRFFLPANIFADHRFCDLTKQQNKTFHMQERRDRNFTDSHFLVSSIKKYNSIQIIYINKKTITWILLMSHRRAWGQNMSEENKNQMSDKDFWSFTFLWFKYLQVPNVHKIPTRRSWTAQPCWLMSFYNIKPQPGRSDSTENTTNNHLNVIINSQHEAFHPSPFCVEQQCSCRKTEATEPLWSVQNVP